MSAVKWRHEATRKMQELTELLWGLQELTELHVRLYTLFFQQSHTCQELGPICADLRHFALLLPLLRLLSVHFRSFVCFCVWFSIINVMRWTPEPSSSYSCLRFLLCFLLVIAGTATIPLYVLFLPSSSYVLLTRYFRNCNKPPRFICRTNWRAPSRPPGDRRSDT